MEKQLLTNQALLILNKPFLKIARTKINVYKGTFFMEFCDDVFRFNIFDAKMHLKEEHLIFKLKILDILVRDNFPHMFQQNLLNKVFELEIAKLRNCKASNEDFRSC